MPDKVLPARLPSLTGLRFVLALCVVLCHLSLISGIFDLEPDSPLRVMEPIATSAVSGFFVLSGFVLTWAHVPGESHRAFWRRRFWRIVPTHVIGWALAVAFFTVIVATPATVMPDGDSAGAAVASLFLVQSWIPDAGFFFSFNAPAWSISCEAFFYALFPVLLAAVSKIPTRRLGNHWAALAAATLLMPLVSTFVPGPQLYDWMPTNATSIWFVYLCPPVRLSEFVLGILTARLVQTGRLPHLNRTRVAAPAVVVFGALPFLPTQYAFGMAMAAPLALIIAALTRADIQGRARLMRHPRLVALGEASFALYLTHYPLMLTIRHMLGAEKTFAVLPGALFVVTLTVLSIALSLAVYRYYELPIMRRWARPRTGASADPTPVDAGAMRAPAPRKSTAPEHEPHLG
ncbi:acyltransferase family protein [Embleya scabrispora]|uniref:acyltransferase family protein n=1 Tax=Embleya scabrispora TaxID=159449 RepID=UPI0003754FD9|nr:acyltransferase [Embleya scabrispora]MYS86104.1 acyltransferase family protein [Streptomyces sp. SID5474]